MSEWKSVIRSITSKSTLGLDSQGYWGVKKLGDNDFVRYESKASIIFFLSLLEIDIKLLKLAINTISSERKDVSTFPFKDIIEEALKNGSEKWVDLAINWVDYLGVNIVEPQALKSVVDKKHLSQRVRQRVLKLLKCTSLD